MERLDGLDGLDGLERPDEIRFADTRYISWDKFGSLGFLGLLS